MRAPVTTVMDPGKWSLWICIVARVRDGQITRIDEYMDSSKSAAWVGTDEAKP